MEEVRGARKEVDLRCHPAHQFRAGVGKGRNEFMPRRSIWKGSFVDVFLLRMQKKRDLLLNRKIWSRRSSILPEFVNCSVRIYNGKTPVRCKIAEGKVGRVFFTRKRRLSRTNIEPGRKRKKGKSKRIWHEKEIRFR
jgi:small subunit ribosomal protein S19